MLIISKNEYRFTMINNYFISAAKKIKKNSLKFFLLFKLNSFTFETIIFILLFQLNITLLNRAGYNKHASSTLLSLIPRQQTNQSNTYPVKTRQGIIPCLLRVPLYLFRCILQPYFVYCNSYTALLLQKLPNCS